jgi:hypothetical protein
MTQGVVPQADPPADTDVRQGVGDPPGCVSWDLQRDGAFDAWRKRINRSQTPKGGDESQRKLKSLLSTRINTPPSSDTPVPPTSPGSHDPALHFRRVLGDKPGQLGLSGHRSHAIDAAQARHRNETHGRA